MTNAEPRTIRLADYQPPNYHVDDVELRVDLGENETLVAARLHCRRSTVAVDHRLWLDGEEMELLSLALNGEPVPETAYERDSTGIAMKPDEERFQLDIETRIHPEHNTRLEGLYRSGGMFCTQCEAEGFRRITFFPDRPDVMARYTVTITADRIRYPVLLSNGNLVAEGESEGNRHWARWYDPFPKPSYLFALVAGDLHCQRDTHTTRSGRDIALAIYTEHVNAGRTDHAMAALKAAMAWDEATYGLECDLDNYLIVAVGDFNMGAMENKGLNVFNTQYVLADPASATDTDYVNIEGVIGHEYFHNWTGNRVTLRDWFQLSLKEGLTVFREQQFSADRGAAAVKRIQAVRGLRGAQFPEDAGPTAHPVRPREYVEINNFYTATVYLKGAELIRMYHTLLGDDGFKRGLAEYFRRHDGQAVTCEDFLAAMADANGTDLDQFARWYSQPGTPVVTATDDYEAAERRCTLHLSQQMPAVAGQPTPQNLHIPVATALLGQDGSEISARIAGDEVARSEHLIELREAQQSIVFNDVHERPVPSLMRGFSAPVQLQRNDDDATLAFLFAHESDAFNRWDAGQQLATRLLLRATEAADLDLPAYFRAAFERTLKDEEADPAFVAEALTLPPESYIGEQMTIIDVDGIHRARETLRRQLALTLQEPLVARYRQLTAAGVIGRGADAMARRRLRNVILDYLAVREDGAGLEQVVTHFDRAENMTDRMAALALLADNRAIEATRRLESFYNAWRDEPLVLDKWFRVQAASRRADALDQVRQLTLHDAFSLHNPNKVRALIGSFVQANTVRFHDRTGAGYAFLTEQIIALDAINPQVAARLVAPLGRWQRYDAERAALMCGELRRIFARESLSNDVHEIVRKSLDTAPAATG